MLVGTIIVIHVAHCNRKEREREREREISQPFKTSYLQRGEKSQKSSVKRKNKTKQNKAKQIEKRK